MNNDKGLKGKDVGVINNQPNLGITIYSDLSAALIDCDTIILTDEEIHTNLEIKEIIIMKKSVICMRSLTAKQLQYLNRLAKDMDVNFEYYNVKQEYEELYYIPQKLYKPKATIIIVGEMFNNLSGMDVTLSINRYMHLKGYKSIIIMEQEFTVLSDIITFPEFLRASKYKESDKIYYLNNFIMNIDTTENPDIIIIQIPDAMMKYNDMLCNGFGVIPFLISQAIMADFFVFCTQYDIIKSHFFNMLSINFENRFGFGIDIINMSNAKLVTQDLEVYGKLSFLHQSHENLDKLIRNNYQESDIPILNCINEADNEKMCKHIMEKLSQYSIVDSLI